MIILHLSTSVISQSAAYRLHKGMLNLGLDSKILVAGNSIDDPTVLKPIHKSEKIMNFLRQKIETLPLKFYPERSGFPFSAAIVPNNVIGHISTLNPSLVHLHWVCGGFLRIESLKQIARPIVWTLHDSWAFTGGCHLPFDCVRYRDGCKKCPVLNSSKEKDISSRVMKRKQKAWKSLNMTIVTPSKWLGECARSSMLFNNNRIETIPNGIDTNIFKPIGRKMARKILSLPLDKKLVLFGAVNSTRDPNKGFRFLQQALKEINCKGLGDKVQIIVFGGLESEKFSDSGLKTTFLGRLHDDISLAVLYSAADVFVAPSIQENLPNTVMEALACGTPCVAFNIGGMPDMIEHQRNGYLARPFEKNDLACGIDWVLGNDSRWQSMSHRAREKVEQEFDIKLIAGRYLKLYQDILSQKPYGG
ncbi:glycosyltransferase family 4 protein [Phosphitispora sp. TUW77]|uniref:glycosyltransferase family 4 protein n=1 Tax=Phosphitispora sp. TUW77 TaxID=3152361 RepID=UPI003AB3844E